MATYSSSSSSGITFISQEDFLLPEQDIKRELGPKRTNIISDLAIIQKEYVLQAVVKMHMH